MHPWMLSLCLSVGLLQDLPEGRKPASEAEIFYRETDAFVMNLLAELEVLPGLALAVVVDDQVALCRGYGEADREAELPADQDTVYYIASATKPFTALAACILDQRGEIDLDSRLAEHLEGTSMPEELAPGEIRLRDLLRHTSGLSNGPITYRLAYSGDHSPEILWRLISATEANEVGRGRFQYTNYGYNLLTILLDRELEKPWQDLLQEELFTPLGLTHTSAYASVPRSKGYVMAAPYDGMHPDGIRRLPLEKADAQMQSAGGMMLSAKDAARWMLFQINAGRLDGHQIVDAELVRRTQEPWTTIDGDGADAEEAQACGAGWMIGGHRGQRLLHHSGGYPGFGSYISFMPDARLGVTALFNEASVPSVVKDVLVGWCYDWWLSRDVTGYFDEIGPMLEQRDYYAERLTKDLENRRSRVWKLERDRGSYTGVFQNELLGEISVREAGDSFEMRWGLLSGIAEPYSEPDSMRFELVPMQGVVASFEFDDDGNVISVVVDGDRFVAENER